MGLPLTTNVTRPRAFGYEVRIDDNYFRLAGPVDIATAPLEAPKVNTAASSEDIRNEYGSIFSRTMFVGGEGLDFAHQPDSEEIDGSRFWDSEHIDISNPSPGNPSKITLTHITAAIETSSDSNLHLAWDGTRLHMGEGNTTRRSTTYTDATPSFADSDPHAGDPAASVLDLTTLGNVMYAALGANGLHSMTAGTWASLSIEPTQKVWGVKLFLLAATGSAGSLLEQVNTSTGARTTLATLPAGGTWLDAKDTGTFITAAASDGNVYFFAPSAADPLVLGLAGQTPIRQDQTPYAVGYDGTNVFVATREPTTSGAIGRLWRFDVDGVALGNAQLLRQWGNQSATIDHAPRQIVAARGGVILGVYETGGSSLWRYDSATGGLSRFLDSGTTGLIVDIVALAGRAYFTVAGHGLYREKIGTYEADGYLIGPLGDLFSASPKSWAGALLDHDEIGEDCRVELYYTTDPAALSDPASSAWVRVKNVVDGQDTTETPLVDVDSRYLAGMVKLYASTDADTAPSVRGFAFRAFPGPGDVIITFLVNTSDVYERPGGRRTHVRGLGDLVYSALRGKEGRYAELELLRPSTTYRGVVTKIATRTPDLPEIGSSKIVTEVEFRGRYPDSYVIYGDPADNSVSSFDNVYATARSGGGTLALNPVTGTSDTVGQTTVIPSGYSCYELFIAFDTSTIPDDATIVSATLELAMQDADDDTAFTLEARLHDWGTAVTTADFVAGASLSSKTLLASRSTTGLPVDEYFTLTDVATLAANINKTGYTRIVLCSSRHTAGTTPTGFESLSLYTGNHPAFRPRLTVVTAGA